VLLWSSAKVCGVLLASALPAGISMEDFRIAVERDVRYANIAIIEGNEASQFGIRIRGVSQKSPDESGCPVSSRELQTGHRPGIPGGLRA